jgi:hypothetical protein
MPIAELIASALEHSQFSEPQDCTLTAPAPVPLTNVHSATRPSKVKRRLIVPGIVATLNPNSSWAAALKMISRYVDWVPHRHVEFSDERLTDLASKLPELYDLVRPLEKYGCPHCSAIAAAAWMCWDACSADHSTSDVLRFFLIHCIQTSNSFADWLHSNSTRSGEKWKTRVVANCILIWNAQSTSAFDPDWQNYADLPEPIRNADRIHNPKG